MKIVAFLFCSLPPLSLRGLLVGWLLLLSFAVGDPCFCISGREGGRATENPSFCLPRYASHTFVALSHTHTLPPTGVKKEKIDVEMLIRRNVKHVLTLAATNIF